MKTAAEIIAQSAHLDVNILVLKVCNCNCAGCLKEFIKADPLAVKEAYIFDYLQGPSKVAICKPCMAVGQELNLAPWQSIVEDLCSLYLKISLIAG